MAKSKKASLAERAQISREMAYAHRQLAEETLAKARQMEADARMMDRGIDPFEGGKRVLLGVEGGPMVTPTTRTGLAQYDDLAPSAAAVAAWTQMGRNPGWHRQAVAVVHQSMPLLARALDRMAEAAR